MSSSVLSLPSGSTTWSDVLDFKVPLKGATSGLIDVSTSSSKFPSFRLIGNGDEPIHARAVSAPYECYTVETLMDKSKGHLSMAIELTPRLWNVFHGIDKALDKFLVAHASKLFSSTDADFIKKDPTSIALKHPKPLARYSADGTPDYGGMIYLRVTGRGSEVETLHIKEGRDHKQYVDKIDFRPRTEALPPFATRFCMVNGVNEKGGKTVCSSIRKSGELREGEPRMRYVGPGDFVGGVLVSATISISHWAIVNGAATICVKLCDAVFENVVKTMEIPDGFELKNESADDPADDQVAENSKKRGRGDNERSDEVSNAKRAVNGNFSSTSIPIEFV